MKPIQQRRPFCQAVESKLVESGRRTRLAIFAVLLFFLLGCSSLTPERVNLLAQIAGQAAQYGAQQWLAKHPDHRLAFDAIIASIAALVKQGETREFKYSELLQSLPTDTLVGPEGAVYVTGTSQLSTNKEQDRIIVYDKRTKKPYHVGGDIRVQRQIVAGLKRAMLPLPPAPGKAKARSTPVLFTPAVSVTNLPVMSLTDRIAGRTNVTRSVVEVTPHAGAASTVTIRWQLGPRSVYHIQHRNEGGTEWYKFGTVTNVSETGPTTWTGTWNPVMPIGSWRVVRIR